jgi:hypothetical protein
MGSARSALCVSVLSLSAACSFGVDLTGYFERADAGALADAAIGQTALRLSPLVASVDPGESVQLTALVTPAQAVRWTVDGAGNGTVSADGVFTAPYIAGSFRIVATAGDGAQAAATVTVAPGVKLLAGRIDGYIDGPAKSARFRFPARIASDGAGNIVIPDFSGNTIRRLSRAGVVSTVAGTPDIAGSKDGAAGVALFYGPTGVCVSANGTIYVAETYNHTIRKILPSGVVSTLAGVAGQVGSADGIGTAARFSTPKTVAVDAADNVYVADSGSHTIRKISPAGVVSTLAGVAGSSGSSDGIGGAAHFTSPLGLASDAAGTLFVSDSGNHTIRKVTPAGEVSTIAGKAGEPGLLDGPGATSRMKSPMGIAVDAAGVVYFADNQNGLLRKIDPAGLVATVSGGGSIPVDGRPGVFSSPWGVAIGPNQTIVVAENTGAIRSVAADGTVTTISGVSTAPGYADGDGDAAVFSVVNAIAVDADQNTYVADATMIRKITPAGTVSTYAGKYGESGRANGPRLDARFALVADLEVDFSGNVIVADSDNHVVRRVNRNGMVDTLAGSPDGQGTADGLGATARFIAPGGVAVDAAGSVYVADRGANTIRQISSMGFVRTVAGQAGMPGTQDGLGATARFSDPADVALDSKGGLFVADRANSTIRRIDQAGAVTTVAGAVEFPGFTDGTAAQFNYPWRLATDSNDNVFVAEFTNFALRKVTPTGTSTLAGALAGASITTLGKLPGHFAGGLRGVAVLPRGTLLVATQYAVYRIVGAR